MQRFTKLFCTAFLLMAGFVSASAQEDEVFDFDASFYHSWSEVSATATDNGEAGGGVKLGEAVAEGGALWGNLSGSVPYLSYANITEYSELRFEGNAGGKVRLMCNRLVDEGPIFEKVYEIGADGTLTVNITDLKFLKGGEACDFVCLQGIKVPYGGSEVTLTSIKIVKPSDPLSVPKTELKSAINAGKLKNSYAKTAASWSALTEAIAAAEAALAADDATQESLEAAKANLNNAINGLQLKGGYSPLRQDMFHKWTSRDGDATQTEDAVYPSNEVGHSIGQGTTVCGMPGVHYLEFANLTGCNQVVITGTPGFNARLLFNREADPENKGALIEIIEPIGEDGVLIIDLKKHEKLAGAEFYHLNSIKTPYNGMTGVISEVLLQYDYSITGDLTGGWDVDADMTATESEGIYTLSVEGFEAEAKAYEYKLRGAHQWNFVYELPGDGTNNTWSCEEAGKYNLTFTANVLNHTLSVTAEKVEEPAPESHLYVIGTGNNWSRTAMTELTFDEAENAYTYEIKAEGNFYFAFADYQMTEEEANADSDWSTFNGSYRYAIAEGDQTAEVDTEYQLQKANGTIVVPAGEYVVYVTKDMKMTVKGATAPEPVEATYTVAGTEDLTGYAWDTTQNEMTLDAESGLYVWTAENITVTADQKPEFKVVKNGTDWIPNGENWVITPEVLGGEGIYTITITFNAETQEIAVSGVKTGEIEIAATDIHVKPESGTDIAAAVAVEKAKVAKVGNITIELAKDGSYTVSAPLVAYKNFEIQANGATIDANELTGNFIEMAATDNPAVTVPVEFVSIHNATLKGLKKPLFYSTQKGYLIEWLTIDNSIVEVAADVSSIDFTKGSAARNVNIENSTVYAPVATTKSFFSSQAGQKLTELDEEGIQSFIIKNATMYNLATGKNFFTHRQNSQKWLTFVAENNIFVNCGKNGQAIKGMNGGGSSTNPTWTISGNVFNFEVDGVMTDTSAAEETGDAEEPIQNSYALVMTFVDPAGGDFNADFTAAENATIPTEKIGDPRWTLNKALEVETTYYLVGSFNDWTPAEDYKLELNSEAGEGVEEYMITLDIPANSSMKVQDNLGNWYPGDGRPNFEVNDEGNFTVYFRPKADGDEFWFEGCIYCNYNGIPTGISSIFAEAVENGKVYNLQGQKVQKTQKGLYIVNGKKMVIK